jgi:hypothetical protein
MSTKVKFVHRHKEYKRDDEVTVSDSQAKEWKEQGLIEIIEKGDFPETGQEQSQTINVDLEPRITGNDLLLAINRSTQPKKETLKVRAPKPTTKKATKK